MSKIDKQHLEGYMSIFLNTLFILLIICNVNCYSGEKVDSTLFSDHSCNDKGYLHRQSVINNLIPETIEVMGMAEYNNMIIVNMKGKFSNKTLADLLIEINNIPEVTDDSITIISQNEFCYNPRFVTLLIKYN